jgi:membrane protein implicated in regulation of membrane protease activity
MTHPEICINQTLLLWCGVVIVEIFILAQLMSFPWIILSALILVSPIKTAFNWPKPIQEKEKNPEVSDKTEGK